MLSQVEDHQPTRNMMKRKPTTRHTTAAFFTGAALIAGTMSLYAQTPPPQAPQQGAQPGGAQTQEMGNAQRLQARAQEIEAELEMIAAEAERNNPELVEDRTAFIEMFESKLEEQGYPDQEEQQKLQQMQMQLQNPEALDEEQRQQLTMEFQQAISEMREAETQVREDPEFQKEQEKLINARTEAMTEVNPEVPALEREREEVFAQLNALMQAQQQGGQP